MATRGWGTSCPVTEWLFEEGYRFDFYQAVKLLELLHPEAAPVGEGSEPTWEPVRFKSKIAFGFPPSEVVELKTGDGQPAEMMVSFLGLAGGHGPLPTSFTEHIIQRARSKDTATRDFLDIFNHRLTSLLYRVRKYHRIAFEYRSPDRSPFARYLFSLAGLGTTGLQDRLQVQDRSLLHYTGLLAQQPRSMIGLESTLGHYFRVAVRGESLVGGWYRLEPHQWTHLGHRGQNNHLGLDTVAGTRVWDQQARFRLRLGPLTWSEFLSFLPTGDAFVPLCQITRFYVGVEPDFQFQLSVKSSEVPESRLGRDGGMRLGWTSWLKTGPGDGADPQVVLSPRSYKISE